VGVEKEVVIGGGVSALSYLGTLPSETLAEVTWIRGPEGLSALGSGAIEIFEPLDMGDGRLTRQELYTATRLHNADLAAWDDAQRTWLKNLNLLGTRLGWQSTDDLSKFRWFPHEDGTLIPSSGNWLTGPSAELNSQIGVMVCHNESEPQRMVDGWNYDSERLGLPYHWSLLRLPENGETTLEAFVDACLDASSDTKVLALHRLPAGLSWFAVRDLLAAQSDVACIPVGGIGGRGVAYEALQRLRDSFSSEVAVARRGRVDGISSQSERVELRLGTESLSAENVKLAVGRGDSCLVPYAQEISQVKLVGSVLDEVQATRTRNWVETHRLALEVAVQ